jgi:hypothetical protein
MRQSPDRQPPRPINLKAVGYEVGPETVLARQVRAKSNVAVGSNAVFQRSRLTSALPSIATKYRTSRDFGMVPMAENLTCCLGPLALGL